MIHQIPKVKLIAALVFLVPQLAFCETWPHPEEYYQPGKSAQSASVIEPPRFVQQNPYSPQPQPQFYAAPATGYGYTAPYSYGGYSQAPQAYGYSPYPYGAVQQNSIPMFGMFPGNSSFGNGWPMIPNGNMPWSNGPGFPAFNFF